MLKHHAVNLPFNRFAICEAAYMLAHHIQPTPDSDRILRRLSRMGFRPSSSVHSASYALAIGEGSASEFLDREDYADTRERLAAYLKMWRHRVPVRVRTSSNGDMELWHGGYCYVLTPEPDADEWAEAFYVVGLTESEPPNFHSRDWNYI